MIGFLLGVTAAGSAGYYYLLGEYNNASAALLLSVQELQASTDKVMGKGVICRRHVLKGSAIGQGLCKAH